MDRGGISREYFQQVFKELLSDGLMLFSVSNTEQITYKVHDMSHEIMGVKDLCYFFGQLLGKALFDRIPVCVSLNHQILYALIGVDNIEWLEQLESFKKIDNDVYNSLKWFRDTDLVEHAEFLE